MEHPRTREQILQQNNVSRPEAYGFSGRAFPLLAFIIGFLSFVLTYTVARSKNPPDIRPFPYVDILRPAVHYPEYLIFRIGMMVYPLLFCLSFQTLKNFLQIKSFEFKGQEDDRLQYFGRYSVVACLLLCWSTASISDGGDLNHEFYFYGSRGYWVLALLMIYKASGIYTDLWSYKHFVPEWSYKFKSYSGLIAIAFVVLYGLQLVELINLGYWPQWFVSFFIIFYVGTLYWDLKNMDLLLKRK